jgi:hypothetical protein
MKTMKRTPQIKFYSKLSAIQEEEGGKNIQQTQIQECNF